MAKKETTADIRKPYSFRFKETLVEDVRKLGMEEDRDLTNMIERILSIFVEKNKNGKRKT